MNNILSFIVRFGSWLLFIIYAVVSCALLFSSNPWQHHVWLTSASAVTSKVYDWAGNVSGYFALKDINEDLQQRNAQLEYEVLHLKQALAEYQLALEADTMAVPQTFDRYSFIVAKVINNSLNRAHNYITINRGELDGVAPEMGVVDRNGVVGIVNITGPHTARIISILNPYLALSCKVKGSEHVGTLQWDGRKYDEALLEELPRHAVFNPGDTIVTSGYSSAFPEGIPVGTVIAEAHERDENFFSLRVKLFTDFSTLSTVRVVRDNLSDELVRIENPEQSSD